MSCRRGVPKNDCGCCKSLAEKIRELWERCANVIKSINGINPDGANNFDILPGAGIQVNPRANGIEIVATGAAPEGVVESVNGILPDEDGNVQIDTGLLTVNGEAPDANGDFSISAGSGIQINAGTNGIEIENTSQGAIYTGVSPIEVNADNEISLKDWTLHSIDYTDLIALDANNNKIAATDILFVFKLESGDMSITTLFLPKGQPIVSTINDNWYNLGYDDDYDAHYKASIFKTTTLTGATITCKKINTLYQLSSGYSILNTTYESNNNLTKYATPITPYSTKAIWCYTR